jgi:hypothetical protein
MDVLVQVMVVAASVGVGVVIARGLVAGLLRVTFGR